MTCTIRFGVLAALFAWVLSADGQVASKQKPVNLLRLPAASVARSTTATAERDALKALIDDDPATVAVFKAAKDAPVEITYGFQGETVAPERLVVRLPVKADGPTPRLEVLVSTADKAGNFRSLYATVLKPGEKPQEYRLPTASAKWIMLRLTPQGAASQVAVADVALFGKQGAVASVYPFTKRPAETFAVIARLKDLSNGRQAISADEAELFADAADGKLDRFSFAEAALIASGVVDGTKRKAYLAKIDALEAESRKATAAGKTPFDKGEMLLKFLHAGPMKNRYAAKQTYVSGILDTGTFNCVSSAALFNILGRRLGLDCRAIEVPDHAFAIVYDGTRHADAETTTPSGFNPERDPKAVKEFEAQTGFRYIPDRYREKRREVGELGLLALICSNHGVEVAKEKKHCEAVLAYFSALCLDPEFPTGVQNARSGFANWGLDLAKQEKFTESLRVVETGLELAPGDLTLVNNRKALWQDWLKSTHAKQGEEKARALGLKLLKDYPGDRSLRDICEGHVGRAAKELRDAGKFKEALAYVERSKALLPNGSDLELQRKVTWQDWIKAVADKEGEDKARALALQLLKEHPGNAGLRDVTRSHVIRLTNHLKNGGKYEEALALAARNKELLKDEADARGLAISVYDAWARPLMTKKEWAKAIAVYEQALKVYPKDSHLENNLKYCKQQASK